MKTIAQEMGDRLLLIEDEAVARFYDIIGFGAEYRAADTLTETRRIVRDINDAGYKVSRLEFVDGIFRMILWHNGVVYAWQDIVVNVQLGSMGGV